VEGETARKLLLAGLLLLLLGFALLIFRPIGRASLYLGAVIFALAFIPLEMARKLLVRANRKA